MTATPHERLGSGTAHLRRWRLSDLGSLVAAAQASWEHLRPWADWAQDRPDEQSLLAFLHGAAAQWATGESFEYAMVDENADSTVMGVCGLSRSIDTGGLEIGYWVSVDHTGRGLATSATAALTSAAFTLPDVTHVEIHVDQANLASRAVPCKLGFHHVDTRIRERRTPGESGRDEIWRLTVDQWPLSHAVATCSDNRTATLPSSH